MRDPAEALRLAERAVALTDARDPDMLDTRAAAEAALGRFEAADSTERRAVELAVLVKHATPVAGMRERMVLYQRRTAYVERDNGGAPR